MMSANPRAVDLASLTVDCGQAIARWEEESLLERLRQAIEVAPSLARLWQLRALALRAVDSHEEALEAIRTAVGLAPEDALIAHAHARIAYEAGIPSVLLFDRAQELAPLDSSVILGRIAALVSGGDASFAIDEMAAMLRQHPAWYEGHAALSRLRWQSGDTSGFANSFDLAVRTRLRDGTMWRIYVSVVARAGQHERAMSLIDQARRHVGVSRTLDLLEAGSLSEAGDLASAEALFARHGVPTEMEHLVARVRHLLRHGRPDTAAQMIDDRLGTDDADDLWPLAAVAWRITGDARSRWLEGDDGFVRVVDLSDSIGSIAGLADVLRSIHVAKCQPLNQSVRGGTQTDGPLLSRLEPELRQLRQAILTAVRHYVDELPPTCPGHPLLGAARHDIRFAGSWSVRLTGSGHHVDHVHPAGWISSAFYVSVPPPDPRPTRDGWLVLGQAPSLGLDLPVLREIQPKVGRLVLFPSTLWHRTIPFPAGERMSIAFDIARPPR